MAKYNLYTKEKLRKGGRTIAKISEDKFLEKAKEFVLEYGDDRVKDRVNNSNKKDIGLQYMSYVISILYWDKKDNTIFNDFKGIKPDFENCEQYGGLRTVKNCPYIILTIGGDWEIPLAVFIYYDGKKFRAYIPTKGNMFRKDTKKCFGNADGEYNRESDTYSDYTARDKKVLSDDAYIFNQLVKDGILDKEKDKDKLRGIKDKTDINYKMCIEDFSERVEPKVIKESIDAYITDMISKSLKESLNLI